MPILDKSADGQKANVMVTEVDISSKEMKVESERRPTIIRPIRQIQNEPLPLDKFIRLCSSQSPFVKALVVSLLSGIPFVIFIFVARFAVSENYRVGPPGSEATLFQLADWLIICWASFMLLLWAGKILAVASSWCCSQSSKTLEYQRLVEAICLRMVFMIWAGVVYAIIPSIFHKSFGSLAEQDAKVTDWVHTLRRAFMFLIIAFAIIFVQGIFLELISIQYIGGWMGPRSKRATDALNTIKELRRLANPHQEPDGISIIRRIGQKLFVPVDYNNEYYQISLGRGNEEVWVDYAHKLWDTIARGRTEITRQDIFQQLDRMHRDTAKGDDLFNKLDNSGDGVVTLEELELLVQNLGQQLNAQTRAQRGVKYLLGKLEVILSIVMLGIIFVIYIYFFQQKYKSDVYSFWTGITGLSFAFGGVLLEFTNSCVFVFGKHAYDVGDYVEAKGKKLVVDKIFLTHTNFEEVTDPMERGTVVQISHASLLTEPIVNWTRTMEEVVDKKKVKADADKAKDKAKSAQEDQEKAEARDLILVKTAHLRNMDPLLENVGTTSVVKKEEEITATS